MIPTANTSTAVMTRFDTPSIVATVNRLLVECANTANEALPVDLQVPGPEPGHPGLMCIVGKSLYKESTCVLTIPGCVDAGALRGLETGTVADWVYGNPTRPVAERTRCGEPAPGHLCGLLRRCAKGSRMAMRPSSPRASSATRMARS